MEYITYYRVSTTSQGNSGLGLAAQKKSVNRYLSQKKGITLMEFTEIESGKKNNRIQLELAIKAAQEHDATLLIAKLDRLSRNAGFIFKLRDAGVRFICCDMPEANELTINIFAILAEHERKIISERTKAALTIKREICGEWRKSNFTDKGRKKAIETIKSKAANNSNNKRAISMIKILHERGESLRSIAKILNDNDYRTSRGNLFKAQSVSNLLKRSQQQLVIA